MKAKVLGFGEIELDGYPVSPAMYRGIGQIDLNALRAKSGSELDGSGTERPKESISSFEEWKE